jgi:hypothetical protein
MPGVIRRRLTELEKRIYTEPKSLWAHVWPERRRVRAPDAAGSQRAAGASRVARRGGTYGAAELSVVSGGASLGAGIVIC